MKYQLKSGEIFEADTPVDLVRQLHETSLAPAETDGVWMEETARRTWQQTGFPVRWSTPYKFVSDLIQIGFVKEMHDDPSIP